MSMTFIRSSSFLFFKDHSDNIMGKIEKKKNYYMLITFTKIKHYYEMIEGLPGLK